jgi:hypothetical protein
MAVASAPMRCGQQRTWGSFTCRPQTSRGWLMVAGVVAVAVLVRLILHR